MDVGARNDVAGVLRKVGDVRDQVVFKYAKNDSDKLSPFKNAKVTGTWSS